MRATYNVAAAQAIGYRGQVSAQELTNLYPDINPDLIRTLANNGASFWSDPFYGVAGQYNPIGMELTYRPGQNVGTLAHEFTHAALDLAPQYFNTSTLNASQRNIFSFAQRAGQSARNTSRNWMGQIATYAQTKKNEQIAFSVAGGQPGSPFPQETFRNVFRRNYWGVFDEMLR